MNKYFIITIDTEGDNLWQWKVGDQIHTENAKYLPRFQELCEKFNFKPVYLTNYEMASDDFFVNYFKEKFDNNLCEIGAHLHAWNNPPQFDLPKEQNGAPYLIEYPKEIMEEKIKTLNELLQTKFNKKIVTHRAGRWATNEDYFKILIKYGYKIDCSVTPHVDWTSHKGQTQDGKGSNYSSLPEKCFKIFDNDKYILETPTTIKELKISFSNKSNKLIAIAQKIKYLFVKRKIWLRPNKNNLKEMQKLVDKCNANDYIMFMLHSSELMAGGSPTFKTQDDIDGLYVNLEKLFSYIFNKGYEGITLKDYAKIKEL